MARTKTKRTHHRQQQMPHPLTTTTTIPSQSENQEDDHFSSSSSVSSSHHEFFSSLLSLLTTSTSQCLQFLNSSDLLLLPSQSLALSSLLHTLSLSLSSLLFFLPTPTPITNNPPNHTPIVPQKFSWFRRFLTASSSPSDPRWLENFRMSKSSFYLLLQTLTPSLVSLSTSPIPPDHKLAAALFRLAHSAPFSFVARRFGLSSPSLACRAFYEVCKAISDSLGHLFELSSDITRISQGFNWMSLPNCCGVLSFVRFPVRGDLLGGSLTAQCLVDSEGRFLDVSVGWLGFMKAQEILMKTKLFTSQSTVLATTTSSNGKNNNNTTSPTRYFIGGSCCPLLPWLLTPYRDFGSLIEEEEVFNTVHARGMELAERAFGRLRGRWTILNLEWKEECAEALPYVVVATCLLHNYLIKCSEPVVEESEERRKTEVGFVDFEGKDDESGASTRNMLALHLSQVIHK